MTHHTPSVALALAANLTMTGRLSAFRPRERLLWSQIGGQSSKMPGFTEDDAIAAVRESARGRLKDGTNGLADPTPGSRTGDGGLCLARRACVNVLSAPRHDSDGSTRHYVPGRHMLVPAEAFAGIDQSIGYQKHQLG